MATLSPSRTSRNSKNSENHVSYRRNRRHITRSFIAIPRNTPKVSRRLQPLLMYLIGLCAGESWCEVSHPRLAAVFECHERTAARWIYRLRDLGVVNYTPRKVSREFNLPNRYTLPHLEGFFGVGRKVSKNADQKPLEVSTKTTTRCSGEHSGNKPSRSTAKPSHTRLAWEQRKRENHPPRF